MKYAPIPASHIVPFVNIERELGQPSEASCIGQSAIFPERSLQIISRVISIIQELLRIPGELDVTMSSEVDPLHRSRNLGRAFVGNRSRVFIRPVVNHHRATGVLGNHSVITGGDLSLSIGATGGEEGVNPLS